MSALAVIGSGMAVLAATEIGCVLWSYGRFCRRNARRVQARAHLRLVVSR